MPNITFDGPRIEDVGRKRDLVRAVTDAAAKAYGLPKQAMVVVIKENSPENVGIGGELLAITRSEWERIGMDAGWDSGRPAQPAKARTLVCTVCGDEVDLRDLRGHLEEHNPNARDMDWEDVRNAFRESAGRRD